MRNAGAVELNSRSPQTVLVDRLARPQGHVDLGAGVVQPHRPGLLDESRRPSASGPTRSKIVALQVGVGDDGPGLDRAGRRPPRPRTRRPATWIFSTLAADADIDAVAAQFRVHQLDQPVGAALERVHALGHEVREDDAVGERRVFQRRAVGVGDRLHQQPHHVLAGRGRTARTAGRVVSDWSS